jgi:hypothetical protein
MKILKVYDKINRNVLQYDQNTGSLTVREFHSDTDYFTLIINTKVFKIKSERMAFLSCINTVNGIARESLDITSKYVFFVITDERGMLIHSERIHLKDNKSILLVDRIYDELGEFIEVENHRGNRTMKFKLKDEIINQLTNIK